MAAPGPEKTSRRVEIPGRRRGYGQALHDTNPPLKFIETIRRETGFSGMEYFGSRAPGIRCDTETSAAALEEMNRYCKTHPGGPADLRRPQLFLRGKNFVVLLGRNVAEGIVGLGSTVPSALRAFEMQYLRNLRPLDPEAGPK